MRLQVLIRILHYFNSIKVRLKLALEELGQTVSQFQFHKGTIKTEPQNTIRTAQGTHFNSIKVRLKRSLVIPIMVGISDFNSIKVRLKPFCTLMAKAGSLFQFHKGTIKTLRSAQALPVSL